MIRSGEEEAGILPEFADNVQSTLVDAFGHVCSRTDVIRDYL